MAKDSFVFYRSFYDAIKKLKKSDQLRIYSHICEYAFGEKLSEIDGVPAAMFDLIKPQIDANIRRFENGKKGGRPKTEPKPKHNLDGTKAKPNVNVNVNDNVNDNENVNVNVNVNAPSGDDEHTTPTLEELISYCNQNGIHTDVEKFYNYNNGKGWPMEWKSALGLWTQKDKDRKHEPPDKNRFNNFKQREYDFEELERQLLSAQWGTQ